MIEDLLEEDKECCCRKDEFLLISSWNLTNLSYPIKKHQA